MKKNRGHIASLLLGGILFLPLVFIIILQAVQFYLSNTATERMEERSLQTVVVDEHLVVWREEGREVTIDGEYFDLISWNLKDGQYTFTGVYDEEETAVMELLGKQQYFWNSIIRLLLLGQCFVLLIYFIIQPAYIFFKSNNWNLFENRYKFLFNNIITPPPRSL